VAALRSAEKHVVAWSWLWVVMVLASNKLGQISRYESCYAVSLNKTRSTPESQLIYKAHIICWTPPGQKDMTKHETLPLTPASAFVCTHLVLITLVPFLPSRHVHSVFSLLLRITCRGHLHNCPPLTHYPLWYILQYYALSKVLLSGLSEFNKAACTERSYCTIYSTVHTWQQNKCC